MKKKQVLFVNDEMRMGGVARILNTLLINLDKDKYEIDLLILHPHGEMLEQIPANINLIKGTDFFETVDYNLLELLKQFSFKKVFKKIRLLFYMKTGLITKKIQKERKKMLSKHYDVEFSAKEGFCTVFVASGDSKLKYNWVQVDYDKFNYSFHHMSLVKKSLKQITLNIASSNQSRISYQRIFQVENVITIHNLMDVSLIKRLMLENHDLKIDKKQFKMITAARFHPQKALDRLFISYEEMLKRGIDCHLYLIGDGELKTELIALAKDLKIYDKIEWLGYQTNPYKFMKDMDIFVMSSIYEGFPTIVVESLLCGLPVLTTKVAGVDEQITKPEQGWIIANDQAALTNKLCELATDSAQIQAMKIKLASYTYENDDIMKKIENLFDA